LPPGADLIPVKDRWFEINEVMNHKCCICETFFELPEKQQLCSKWNARLPVAMTKTMFAKRLTSLIFLLLVSFLLFKEGRVEAVGEFYFACWALSLCRLYGS